MYDYSNKEVEISDLNENKLHRTYDGESTDRWSSDYESGILNNGTDSTHKKLGSTYDALNNMEIESAYVMKKRKVESQRSSIINHTVSSSSFLFFITYALSISILFKAS